MINILVFRNFGIVIIGALLLSQMTVLEPDTIGITSWDLQERKDLAVFTGANIVEEEGSLFLQGVGVSVQFSEGVKIAVGNRSVVLSFVGAKGAHPKLIEPDAQILGDQHIVYEDLYQGLDMVFSLVGGRLKSSFIVWDTSALSRLAIRYEGASLSIVDGVLNVGDLWHETGLILTTLEGSVLRDQVEMKVEGEMVRYFSSAKAPFVIDPNYSFLVFSTYMGGVGSDTANSLVLDDSGNIYVVGDTGSSNMPIVGGNATFGGGVKDVFLASFAPDGQLKWSTYFGGSNDDRAEDIVIVNNQYVYIVGATASSDLPMVNSYNSTYGGNTDAFVASFYLNGTIYWSTFLGGSDYDYGLGVAIMDNRVVVTGQTFSTDFPIISAAQPVYGGGGDAFVTSFNYFGSIGRSTYLGGSGSDVGYAVAAGQYYRIFVGGITNSADLPTVNASDTTYGGNGDGFVAYLDNLNSLIFLTYLGGAETDSVNDMVGNSSGVVHVTGQTGSPGFPVTLGKGHSGGDDVFVTSYDKSGSLQRSQLLGTSDFELADSIVTDDTGQLYILGSTNSQEFPLNNSYDSTYIGDYDYFIVSLDAQGTLLWSVLLGGTFKETGNGLVVSSQGIVYVAGMTNSGDLPAVNSFNSTYGASFDMFIYAFYDPLKDYEGDGFPNLYEYGNGLNLTKNDADEDLDGDGMPNLYEFQNGLNVTKNDADEDLDGDGMTNLYEYTNGLNVIGNDANEDLDGDGMPNLYEYLHGLNVTKDDAGGDVDSDGLSNILEFSLGTDPQSPDTDADGMPDLFEYENGLNYTVADADKDLDGDGIPNLYEYQYGLRIGVDDAFEDADWDGMPNLFEYQHGMNSSKDESFEDLDGDGMPNLWEYENRLEVEIDDAGLDKDGDGILNLWEYRYGLDPNFDDSESDKDDDGMPNLWEHENGLNPLLNDASADADGDGMSNLWEYEHGLDPQVNDAAGDIDGDGLTNIEEYLLDQGRPISMQESTNQTILVQLESSVSAFEVHSILAILSVQLILTLIQVIMLWQRGKPKKRTKPTSSEAN